MLSRLATEPAALSEVANAALMLMHFNKPAGDWVADELDQLEQKKHGLALCEAGCYQCLLSYFNQPDHDNINRRNPEALQLLVAIANAEVRLQSADSIGAAGQVPTSTGEIADRFQAWLQILALKGLRQPDALNVPISQGGFTAAGQYKSSRTLVFLEPITPETKAMLSDKGWQVLDFSDDAQWEQLFTDHAALLGASGVVSP